MAGNNVELTAEDIGWIESYVAGVRETFGREFEAAAERFKEGLVLLERFNAAVESVLKNGRGHFRAVDEAHNELCIASALLASTRLKFVRVEYEPPLPGCAKTIDFRGTAEDGLVVYVDVKTIKPEAKDRWEQFEKAVKEERFPENATVALSQDWLGGEIWHDWFAARGRMLEYSLELEQKIAGCGVAKENTVFVMAFCGNGVDWHESQLEDFVSFYYKGVHRSDDAFSQMEKAYIAGKKIEIRRTISQFAYVKRSQGQIRPSHIEWRVRPPRDVFL